MYVKLIRQINLNVIFLENIILFCYLRTIFLLNYINELLFVSETDFFMNNYLHIINTERVYRVLLVIECLKGL